MFNIRVFDMEKNAYAQKMSIDILITKIRSAVISGAQLSISFFEPRSNAAKN